MHGVHCVKHAWCSLRQACLVFTTSSMPGVHYVKQPVWCSLYTSSMSDVHYVKHAVHYTSSMSGVHYVKHVWCSLRQACLVFTTSSSLSGVHCIRQACLMFTTSSMPFTIRQACLVLTTSSMSDVHYVKHVWCSLRQAACLVFTVYVKHV